MVEILVEVEVLLAERTVQCVSDTIWLVLNLAPPPSVRYQARRPLDLCGVIADQIFYRSPNTVKLR
jgi:hypothetical protein